MSNWSTALTTILLTEVVLAKDRWERAAETSATSIVFSARTRIRVGPESVHHDRNRRPGAGNRTGCRLREGMEAIWLAAAGCSSPRSTSSPGPLPPLERAADGGAEHLHRRRSCRSRSPIERCRRAHYPILDACIWRKPARLEKLSRITIFVILAMDVSRESAEPGAPVVGSSPGRPSPVVGHFLPE